EHGLDDEVDAVQALAEVAGRPHPIQRRIRHGLRQPALLDSSRQVSAIGVSRLAKLCFVLVLQGDLDTMQSGLLGDLRTHAAGADHSEPRHWTEKMRVTVFSVAMLLSKPSIRSLPCSSFDATPRPTPS